MTERGGGIDGDVSRVFRWEWNGSTPSSTKRMAQIYDDETANKIALLWTPVEDAVAQLDECMKTESAEELAQEWRVFKKEFDRFDEVVTDAIET